MAAERPVYEPLFGENAQVRAQWDNVVTGAVVDANLMFERTELGDWAFDEIKAPPRDPHGQMRHRETLKLMALTVELAAALAKVPFKNKRAPARGGGRGAGGEGEGEGEGEREGEGEGGAGRRDGVGDEPAPGEGVGGGGEEGGGGGGADKPAPLKKVVMTMVYEKVEQVHNMLRRNAADPEVADYTGVVGVAYYLVRLRPVPRV